MYWVKISCILLRFWEQLFPALGTDWEQNTVEHRRTRENSVVQDVERQRQDDEKHIS
jgi:hypothetical protein